MIAAVDTLKLIAVTYKITLGIIKLSHLKNYTLPVKEANTARVLPDNSH
jgi:LysM repeat protein